MKCSLNADYFAQDSLMQGMRKFHEMAKRESEQLETEFNVSRSTPKRLFIYFSFPLDLVETLQELLSPRVEGLCEGTDILP